MQVHVNRVTYFVFSLNRNLETATTPNVITYTPKRCSYSSGNIYRQGDKLIIGLTVKVNTTITSYDTIVEGLPAIRSNIAVLNYFNATKGSATTTAVCQDGTIKLIGGTMPAIGDGIAITGECLISS